MPSKKFLKMAKMYERFAVDSPQADFSDEALEEMYHWESEGIEMTLPDNGYALGKKWMDVALTMWREDIQKGLLLKIELEEDYPLWFLKQTGIWYLKQGNFIYGEEK